MSILLQQAPYCYSIHYGNKKVTGLVITLNLEFQKNITIVPHEATSTEKIEGLQQHLLLTKQLTTPLIIGLNQGNPLFSILENALKKTILIHQFTDHTHTLSSLDVSSIILINEIFQKELTCFLLDGHHRYHALKEQKNGLKKITFWVVPIEKMQIKSFLKVITVTDIDRTELLIKSFLTHTKCSKGSRFFIFANTHCHPAQEPITSSIEAIDHFIQDLIRYNLLSKLDHIPYTKSADLTASKKRITIATNQLLLIPTSVNKKELLELIQSKKILPMHSTYFFPKPLDILFQGALQLYD